jgi:photosystem II stability/assembly factor-like uncharacterized protein
MKINFTSFILIFFIFLSGCTPAPNEGKTNSSQNIPARKIVTFENLFGLDAYGQAHAWIVGFEGTIVHTSDGGKTWNHQMPPVQEDFYDVAFIDEQTGWIVGKYGTILHTTNGGKDWIKQVSGTDQRLFKVHFLNKDTGWAVGTFGTILHTSDGGKSWITQGAGEDRYYNGVFFIDERHGWIVGEYALIYHTSDGGVTWASQKCDDLIPVAPEKDFPPPPPHLYGVWFISPETGWATGLDGVIIRTDDGGITWKRLSTGAKYALYKVTVIGQHGWAVGDRGQYLMSTDSGASWNKRENLIQTRFWLKDVAFTDEQHGWIIGAMGTIVNTVDGGRTWNKISGSFIQ